MTTHRLESAIARPAGGWSVRTDSRQAQTLWRDQGAKRSSRLFEVLRSDIAKMKVTLGIGTRRRGGRR